MASRRAFGGRGDWCSMLMALMAGCSQRSLLELSADDLEMTSCTTSGCVTSSEQIQYWAGKFLTEPGARRDVLESSLLYTDNSYARERLANYAVPNGWDALPEFDPPSALVYVDGDTLTMSEQDAWSARHLHAGAPVDWSREVWITAGRDAFFAYPVQRFVQLSQVIGGVESVNSNRLSAFGLWVSAQGQLGGLVSVESANGAPELSFTCSTCHASVGPKGEVVAGVPSRVHITAFSQSGDWGPGKVDVTADNQVNPVAIADLRATRVQRRLHHTGNLQNSLLALAARIETLLITNRHGAARPPRELAFALAVYIWELGENLANASVGLESAKRLHTEGAAVFAASCASCHSGEWGEGEWASLGAVGTEPLVALSTARGTGGYRVPALLGFQERPLTHEARRTDVETWLRGDPAAPNGDVVGHAERAGGVRLEDVEMRALVTYLRAAFPARDGR